MTMDDIGQYMLTLNWLGDVLSAGACGREWALHYINKGRGQLVAHHW